MAFRGMLIYAGRDFKKVSYTKQLDKNTVVQAVISAGDAWPDPSHRSRKLVRATAHIGGHVFRVLEDGSLEVTFVMQADFHVPGIPRLLLLNAPFMIDMPATLGKLKKMMYEHPNPSVFYKVNRPWRRIKELAPLKEDERTPSTRSSTCLQPAVTTSLSSFAA